MIKSGMNTRDICMMALFTALTAVMAQISIPMPLGVPMTMQTFAIMLTSIVLGARKGFISVLAYILLGIVGVPVFAKFQGGMGIVFGPTGGFILSFPLMAWLVGIGAERGGWWAVAAGLLAGTLVNYAGGMLMFCLITKQGIQAAFFACVFPFIPTAAIKAVMAALIGVRLRARNLVPA
jgi:biotin transport system substrate-specific component